VTGCGCPVDTSVCNTEAPTEAAAETLNLRLPLAVPDDSKLPFLACRPLRHFKLAPSSTGCARVQCLTPGVNRPQIKKYVIQKKKAPTPKGISAFLVRVTGCGCPVDTSVCNTEAPTEAAAETLNLRLPLAVPDDSKLPFLACRPLRLFELASSHAVSTHSQSLTPWVNWRRY